MKLLLIALCVWGLMVGAADAGNDSSYKIARDYLEECEDLERIPPIGHMGPKTIQQYWDTVPKLTKLREQFIEHDEALSAALKKDDDYKAACDRYENAKGSERSAALKEFNQAKSNAYSRFRGKSSFERVLKRRQESLLACNLETLEYIIDDYEKQGKPFPIDWIK